MLDPENLRLGTDEHGTRIKIFTAELNCAHSLKAKLGSFRYTGETIAAADAEDTTTEMVTEAEGIGGHLKSGRSRHGHGEVRYDSGSHYVGQWSRGKRQGNGKFVFACGDVYDGEWLGGMYNGKGRYSSVDSEGHALEYDGDWVRDKMEGHGRYIYKSSGDVYEGSFVNGFREGFGKYKCANGDLYLGEYDGGALLSKTKLDKSNFAVGTDEHGLRIRLFTATTTGERALKAGLGSFRYTGETIASADAEDTATETVKEAEGIGGHLASGRSRHGHGEIYYDSGSYYAGQWCRGKRQGKGKFVFACGDVYDGEWLAGQYHGKGSYSSVDSDSYDGEWQHDKMHGLGKFTHGDSGDVYEGGFVDGLKDGVGKYTSAKSGEVCERRYNAGELV